jgi:hypothetical protein
MHIFGSLDKLFYPNRGVEEIYTDESIYKQLQDKNKFNSQEDSER